MRKALIALSAFSLAAFFVGCNESSTSASDTPDITSSETVETISSDSNDPISSAAEEIASCASVEISSASVESSTSTATPLAVVPDEDGFYDIADIYSAAPATSKIAFVIRHAEREDSLGQLSNLTENGVAQALALGSKLVSEEAFHYGSTDFVRTRATASYIAEGRGEVATVDTLDEILDGNYFIAVPSDSFDSYTSSHGGSWTFISRWAYNDTVANPTVNANLQLAYSTYFYDLFERGNQFVSENIVANISNWSRVSVLVTHDVLVAPLIIYASNRAIDLQFFASRRWANYLSGIAVVVDEAGGVLVYPVRGAETGYMYP
ncbi:MAG: histidine phosphatase family protein [Fibrobacter sp.]|nr:histidine phosphatase family protein [Fibrobacter sp.]